MRKIVFIKRVWLRTIFSVQQPGCRLISRRLCEEVKWLRWPPAFLMRPRRRDDVRSWKATGCYGGTLRVLKVNGLNAGGPRIVWGQEPKWLTDHNERYVWCYDAAHAIRMEQKNDVAKKSWAKALSMFFLTRHQSTDLYLQSDTSQPRASQSASHNQIERKPMPQEQARCDSSQEKLWSRSRLQGALVCFDCLGLKGKPEKKKKMERKNVYTCKKRS